MNGTRHCKRIGHALLVALFVVSMLFAGSAATAAVDATPAHPVVHGVHDVAYGLAETSHPEGSPAHEAGCRSHAQCSTAVAMLAPGGRSIHTRAIAAPVPLVLLLPGGLSAVPHAKPPIV